MLVLILIYWYGLACYLLIIIISIVTYLKRRAVVSTVTVDGAASAGDDLLVHNFIVCSSLERLKVECPMYVALDLILAAV